MATRSEKIKRVIDEGTYLPIGIVGSILGAVVGVTVWLTNIHARTVQNQEKLVKIDDIEDQLNRMDRMVSYMAGRMGYDAEKEMGKEK